MTGRTDEPTITIDGHVLTSAQANAVRVAIDHFSRSPTLTAVPGLGSDAAGRRIRKAYRARLREVEKLIYGE